MKCLKTMAMLLCAAAFAATAAEEHGYISSLRVGNPAAEQSTAKGGGATKSGGRNSRTSVKTKTTSRSVSWPVTVSFSGKSLPAAGSVKLECYFIGATDGRTVFLGEKKTIPVVLDEKGVFKTDVTSPTEKLVRTKTITSTRGRGRGRRRGGSTSVKSDTKGSRVTGCIIQLVINDSVEKSFVSNSNWSKAAKTYPLPESEIIK